MADSEIRADSKVRIVLTGHGRGNVWVDGQEIQGIIRIFVQAGMGDKNLITLNVVSSNIEIEGLMEVKTTDVKLALSEKV